MLPKSSKWGHFMLPKNGRLVKKKCFLDSIIKIYNKSCNLELTEFFCVLLDHFWINKPDWESWITVQQQKNTKNKAAETSLRSFLFCDNFSIYSQMYKSPKKEKEFNCKKQWFLQNSASVIYKTIQKEPHISAAYHCKIHKLITVPNSLMKVK